jgi:hypothetical protein
MKACAAISGIAPLILNLGARMDMRGQYKAPVALLLEVYPDVYGIGRLGRVRSRPGGFEEQKNLFLILGLYGQDFALNQITPHFSFKLSNQFPCVISIVKCSLVKFKWEKVKCRQV